MNRLMNYCGKWIRHGGWYPEYKIRIFDRRFVSWTGGQVHETLAIPAGYETVRIDGDLYHYSYYSEAEFRRQTEKFAHLSAEDAIAKGKKAQFLELALIVFGVSCTITFSRQVSSTEKPASESALSTQKAYF